MRQECVRVGRLWRTRWTWMNQFLTLALQRPVTKTMRILLYLYIVIQFSMKTNSCSDFDKVADQAYCSPVATFYVSPLARNSSTPAPGISTMKDRTSSKGRISGTPSACQYRQPPWRPYPSGCSWSYKRSCISSKCLQQTRPNMSSELLHITIGYLCCSGVSTITSLINFLHQSIRSLMEDSTKMAKRT